MPVLRMVMPPEAEPVTLDMVKAHAVVEHGGDDALLAAYLAAVREHGESLTGRQFAQATFDLVMNVFPFAPETILPRPPLQSVESVSYTDLDGNVRILVEGTDYAVFTGSEDNPGRVYLPDGVSWPSDAATGRPDAVTIRFSAGWPVVNGEAATPEAIKAWILTRAAGLYAVREPMVNGQVSRVPRDFVDALLDRWIIPGSF